MRPNVSCGLCVFTSQGKSDKEKKGAAESVCVSVYTSERCDIEHYFKERCYFSLKFLDYLTEAMQLGHSN